MGIIKGLMVSIILAVIMLVGYTFVYTDLLTEYNVLKTPDDKIIENMNKTLAKSFAKVETQYGNINATIPKTSDNIGPYIFGGYQILVNMPSVVLTTITEFITLGNIIPGDSGVIAFIMGGILLIITIIIIIAFVNAVIKGEGI